MGWFSFWFLVFFNFQPESPASDEWIEEVREEGVEMPELTSQDVEAAWFREWGNEKLSKTRQMITFTCPDFDSGTGTGWRYRIRISEDRHWEARGLIDQDPLEKYDSTPVRGVPDHISGGMLFYPSGWVNSIAVGDFHADWGFGGILSSSPEFIGGLPDPGWLHRPGRGIRLHSGSDELRYLRGIAAGFSSGRLNGMIFGSARRLELNTDTCQQEMAGAMGEILLRQKEVKIGFGWVIVEGNTQSHSSHDWALPGPPVGIPCHRLGAWAQQRLKFGILFGEFGWSPDNGACGLAGLRLFEVHGFSSTFRISSVSPEYPVWFTRHQTGTQAHRSRTTMLFSLKYSPSRAFSYQSLFNWQSDFWPDGSHFSNPALKVYQRINLQKEQLGSVMVGAVLDYSGDDGRKLSSLSARLSLSPDPGLCRPFDFRFGIQYSCAPESGRLASGFTGDFTLTWESEGEALRTGTGFRCFGVDPGAPGIYAYEPDVTYGWSIPCFTGSGVRWHGFVRWKITRWLVLEGKMFALEYLDPDRSDPGNGWKWGGKIQIIIG